jgi:hypothetical protein
MAIIDCNIGGVGSGGGGEVNPDWYPVNIENFKKWDEKVKNHDEINLNEETKMAIELSEIIIGWKRGIPSVYEDCEDIEWIDGNEYDELHFTMNGRDNTLKLFHGSLDSIRVIW